MASHGRRGLSGLLLGSETQKVPDHSKIPGARLSLIDVSNKAHASFADSRAFVFANDKRTKAI